MFLCWANTGIWTQFKITRREWRWCLLAILMPLCVGAMIYFIGSGRPIFLSGFSELFAVDLDEPRVVVKDLLPTPPLWIFYFLPDGLWTFALAASLGIIWRGLSFKTTALVMAAAPLFAFVWELGQRLGWLGGGFDAGDLVIATIAWLLAVGAMFIQRRD